MPDQHTIRQGEYNVLLGSGDVCLVQQIDSGRPSVAHFYGFGISYSFGSIFDNIVNPRFNGPGFFFFLPTLSKLGTRA